MRIMAWACSYTSSWRGHKLENTAKKSDLLTNCKKLLRFRKGMGEDPKAPPRWIPVLEQGVVASSRPLLRSVLYVLF